MLVNRLKSASTEARRNGGTDNSPMKKYSYLGVEFTREEFWGKPSDWLIWGTLMFGSPVLLLYGLNHFPLQDLNDPFYWYGSLASLALSFFILLSARKAMFPQHATRGYKVVVTIIMAFPVAMGLMGLFFCLNGIFRWKL